MDRKRIHVQFPWISLFLFLLISTGAGTGLSYAASEEALDEFILKHMQARNVAGLAAAIVKDNRICWSKGYGLADVENSVPVTTDTLFMIASISKTVTAAALMQLYEQGLFELDDDINQYLPFSVRNPFFPDEALTFRMLLAHTSSIKDPLFYMRMYQKGDPDSEIGEFLESYFTPGGQEYLRRNFYVYKPGNGYNYSNIGFMLIGYLVERITLQPFYQYCAENIFQPLGMQEAGWFLEGLDVSHIALPYLHVPLLGYWTPGHYSYPDYPSGTIRTSVTQLAYFLLCFINAGTYNEVQLLEEQTVQMMLTLQYPDIDAAQGLCWYSKETAGEIYWGHDGADPGVATQMFFRPSDGVGVVVLTNATLGLPFMNRIEKRLFEEADILLCK